MPSPLVPSPLAQTDLSGRQLGDFLLLRRLGHGAMADVYLAEQSRLKRRVAMKILKPELAADRTYLQRFELEAQAAASLVHANIVQIYEVGCVDSLHYIAQEYVDGQNLREQLGRHGPPDLPHALSIMRQVAAALAKAAEHGVVHRDIKPENIMLTAGGEVKVADFGLARLAGEGGNELTQVGITLGTPLYMSPEQVEGKALDPRSDIYSFGVTCYQMLGGEPPFRGETALAVAVQHLKARPRPLESLRGDLPPALCRIVEQMLAKEPSRRFATARDLLRELRRVQIEHFGSDWPEDLPGWDSLAAETAPDLRLELTEQLGGLMKTVALARPRRRRWAWLATALLVAFLTGGLAAWCFAVPSPLLAGAQASASIPKQNTVLRQWYLASQIDTEAAWKSVIENFPKKEEFTLRAEQQLAMLYLHEGEFDRAMAICDKLAKLGADAVELQAFGLAGQCVILSRRGQYRQSAEALAQLLPKRDKLNNESLQKLVDAAEARNDAHLDQQNTPDWENWFE
jgi:serine/threonine-protein kinase